LEITHMARNIRRSAASSFSPALAYMPAADDAVLLSVKAQAEKKMAVVDALNSRNRALVHEISLRAFKKQDAAAYGRAKKKTGVGHTRSTQGAKVPALLAAR
jgi:hypothetical protein